MSDERMSPPTGWGTEHAGEKSATFFNDKRGLEVSVRAVYDKSDGHRRTSQPSHYVVEISQDLLSKATLGNKRTAARTDSWDDALAVAEELMEAFTSGRSRLSRDRVQTIHRSVEDHEDGKQLLDRMLAVDALTDSLEYSNDLFLETLADLTDCTALGVVHRDGSRFDVIASSPDEVISLSRLEDDLAAFEVDTSTIEGELPLSTVAHLEDHSIYRCLFGEARETVVVLPRGTRVVSPVFEDVLLQLLRGKWDADDSSSTRPIGNER